MRFKRIATHVLAGDLSKLISETIHSTTNVYSTWYGLLHYYSRRIFTVASDRLAALAGFASRMQVMLEDEYCAGLWKGDLIRGLLWNHGRHHRAGYPSADDNGGLRGENIGPSWSWASLEGELDSWPNEVVSIAEVIDIHVDALDGNNFSRVNGGRLVIAAPFISWNHSETAHPLERFVTMLVTKPNSLSEQNTDYDTSHTSDSTSLPSTLHRIIHGDCASITCYWRRSRAPTIEKSLSMDPVSALPVYINTAVSACSSSTRETRFSRNVNGENCL